MSFRRVRRVALLTLAVLGASLAAPRARADPPRREDFGARPVDARPELWVVRAPLLPVYAVSELVVRRPIGAVIREVEKQKDEVEEDGPTAIPSLYVENGFRPWVGGYVAWKHVVVRDHQLHVHAGFGGIQAITAAADSRVRLASGVVGTGFSGLRRDDAAFYGLGPLAAREDRVRYALYRVEGNLRYVQPLGKTMAVEARGSVRGVVFEDVTARPDLRALGRDYLAVSERVAVVLDSRPIYDPLVEGTRVDTPVRLSGVRLALSGELAADTSAPRAWTRISGDALAQHDLGHRRTVSLEVHARFVEPLTRDAPFTELAALGGEEPMRGLRPGRLLGRSALAATASYEWPIWLSLGAGLDVAAGNAFGAGLQGFELGLLRAAWAARVYSVATPNHRFELLFGAGTEPLGQGLVFDEARIKLGMTRGF